MRTNRKVPLMLGQAALAAAFCLTSSINVLAANGSEAVNFDAATDTQTIALQQKKWIHGSADCTLNADVKVEVFQYDPTSYVLRQNKCQNFEAPFIYVLIGEYKVLVLDTGAIESSADSPLYETVQSLVYAHPGNDLGTEKEVIVIHSHSHNDHRAGDAQFEGKPNVTLVKPSYPEMTEFLGFVDWPNGLARFELGGRKLIIIPTPGHQEEAISIYDPQTKWLLTGDTLYPGKVYVKNWDDYAQSIDRLVHFSETHTIGALLGAHIEMSNKPGELYPIGSTFQPDEAPLALGMRHLTAIHSALEKSNKAHEISMPEIVVVPMGVFQRTLSDIVRWIVR